MVPEFCASPLSEQTHADADFAILQKKTFGRVSTNHVFDHLPSPSRPDVAHVPPLPRHGRQRSLRSLLLP